MTFRNQTIAGLVGVIALTLIMLMSINGYYLRSTNERQLSNDAKKFAQLFAASIKNAVISTDIASLRESATEIMRAGDIIRLTILSEDGTILAGAQSAVDDEILRVVVPIDEAGIRFGTVVLEISRTAIEEAVKQSGRIQFAIAAIGMFIGLIFTWLLGRYLTQRLDFLKNATNRIAGGELGFTIETGKRDDEFSETIDAFNKMSSKLHASESRKGAIFQASIDSIFILNELGTIVDANQTATKTFGYEKKDLLGRSIAEIISISDLPRDVELVHASFPAVVDAKLNQCFETTASTRTLKTFQADVTISRVDIDTGACFAVYARDITARKVAEEKLNYLAFNDELTGLLNRNGLRRALDEMMTRDENDGYRPAMILLGIDRFKSINDSLGHDVGDDIVTTIAERLTSITRRRDIISRYGGDEFAIIVNDAMDRQNVQNIVTKILEQMRNVFEVDEREIYVNASIGIAMYSPESADADTLIRNADTAMSQAKLRGGNQYRFYSKEMSEYVKERLYVENELRHALDRGELDIYYQPQFSTKTKSIASVEALLRWNHPDMGMISPLRFISLAEEVGLIEPIGEWVLQRACSQIRSLLKLGIPPIKLAVNFSAKQFRNRELASVIERTLLNSDFPPQLLEVEITESLLMENPDNVADILEQIHEYGCHIAIDDFGTGYSSLSYLKKFPIDILKIDRSFVKDIGVVAENEMIIDAIINMANGLRMELVAEGVESEQQMQFLVDRDVQKLQGFLFSAPVPFESFVQYLQNGTKHPINKSIR